ncbi:synaptotagmin-5-like isoform X2 [Ornithodoros turicata]|uniref:synaptotagmin-5-like isoform X2 n=1 Tax=Ornithodoros turicata TaxID=34597 RepID=UPI00313A17F4
MAARSKSWGGDSKWKRLAFKNFAIFREQPRRSDSATPPLVCSSSGPVPGGSAPQTTNGTDHMCVRLSLPDVHLPDEKVSPSHSSYSLPTMRRRSPVVARAKSVDARAMPFIHRLSISGRSDSQELVPGPKSPSPFIRTPSPEHAGDLQHLDRPSSPAAGRPRSLSPLLSPAYSVNSDTTNAGAISPIGPHSLLGNIQPDLYKKKDTVFFQSKDSRCTSNKFGRLHFRLKYDFDKSDLVVHVIEAMELGQISDDGFNDPYIKVKMLPEVDSKQRQTLIRRNSTDPFFNETFKFPVSFDDVPTKTLLFQVFDYDRFSRNDVTGEVRVPLSDIDVTTETEVWCEIEKTEKVKHDRPEVLLSLSYLPSAGRLTVVVLKASNLVPETKKEKPDTYVKVSLTCGDRKVKKKKTSTKKTSGNPVWNEALCFDVGSSDDLQHAHLAVAVCHHGTNAAIGACLLGLGENSQQAAHWQDMLANPRKSIAMWHSLEV